MRIKKLYLESYKKFQPNIDINLGGEIQIFVGINGSGKSSIFEAIAHIFTKVKQYCLDGKPQEGEFNFKIDYSFYFRSVEEESSTTVDTKGILHDIELCSSGESGMLFSMAVDGNIITTREEMFKYLPDNLIFYYAGYSHSLKDIVRKIELEQLTRFYNHGKEELGNNLLTKNIIYIKDNLFSVLFLLEYLNDNIRIPLSGEKFEVHKINLVLQKPNFKTIKSDDYKNLYNLKGVLRTYLDDILKTTYSGQVVYEKEENLIYIPVEYHKDLIYVIQNMDINDNVHYNNDNFFFFHIMNLLFEIGILKDIYVSIKTEKSMIPFSINELSEGEQQLITLNSLKKYLLKDNSVLMLDEPDAFLHPQRQEELISFLTNSYTKNFNLSQIILATHSPNVLNNTNHKDIKITILDNGEIIAEPTLHYGKTISYIYYNLMGTKERPKNIQDKLDVLFRNIEIENITESEKIYNELYSILGDDDEALIKANFELEYLKTELDGAD